MSSKAYFVIPRAPSLAWWRWHTFSGWSTKCRSTQETGRFRCGCRGVALQWQALYAHGRFGSCGGRTPGGATLIAPLGAASGTRSVGRAD